MNHGIDDPGNIELRADDNDTMIKRNRNFEVPARRAARRAGGISAPFFLNH